MAVNILNPGEILQGYVIEKTLGVGGFGVVYLAHEAADISRQVAIKLLQPRFDRKEENIARQAFLNEIINMASLCQEEEGIVHVYNTLIHMTPTGVQLGVVMEFLRGESLFDYIKKQGKMVHERAIPLLLLILKTLGFAHKKGIIHRDIKPENIMVLTGSTLTCGAIATHPIKIMDFGLSKAFEGDVTTESTGWGSSAYMPPERIKGVGVQIDATSDIYSVGVLAYVMLTGQFPFDLGGADQFAALRIVTTAAVPSVRESYEFHPAELDGVIAKALAREPAGRYQSCEAMAVDLAALMPGAQGLLHGAYTVAHPKKPVPKPIVAVPTEAADVVKRPSLPPQGRTRSSLPLVLLGILVGVLLLVGGALLILPRGSQRSGGSSPSTATVTTHSESSLERLRRAAKAGDVESQFELAKLYYYGTGVAKDDKEAFKWYLAAAEGGHKKSQFNVGLMNAKGIGTEKSSNDAEAWFKKAAGQGDIDAMLKIGSLYIGENRVDDATFWLEKAQAEGEPQACMLLASICESRKDYKKAYEFYKDAYDKGIVEAAVNIGVLYWESAIGNKQYGDAVKWYEKAAGAGNATALYNLGIAYRDGRGVPKSRDEALRYFKQAASKGAPDAKKQIEALERP